MNRRLSVVVPVVMLASVAVTLTAAFNLARVVATANAVQPWLHEPLPAAAATVIIYALYFVLAGTAGYFVAVWSHLGRPDRAPGFRDHLRDCALLYVLWVAIALAWLGWPGLWAGFVLDWSAAIVGALVGDAAGIRRVRRVHVARAV